MTIDDGGSDGGGERLRQVIFCYLFTQVDKSSLKRKTRFGNGIDPTLRKNVIYFDS